MKIVRNLFLLAGLAIAGTLQAQVDPHFSQYYVYPSWLNPALTGAFDGQYRVSGIYRNQWGSISSPFSTAGLSAEVTTEKNLNIGASVLNQQAGNGGYGYTTGYMNFAYTGARFGKMETGRLVFALQVGAIQRRFDRSKMTFGDQWNPVTGYNPGVGSADMLRKNSSASFDAGAGVMYFDAAPGKTVNVFGGAAMSHLTKPVDHFSEGEGAKIPMRYTFHGGLRINLSDVFSITPNGLYLRQGSAQERMVGAYGSLKAAEDLDLMIGANYRFGDAASPFVGFTYRNWVLGASYDINTSDLGRMSKGANSFEISLSVIGRKAARTPEVDFVCPRL